MCGITGIIGGGNYEVLKTMTSLIRSRGPDGFGVKWFQDKCAGLGHCRLSIIDLSDAGSQPMKNDDSTLWITYNGEVYNYKEIRKEIEIKGYKFYSDSDTEVVLKAYQIWGNECLEKFNGMFAFAIYNSKTGELFAARDRLGIKPLYYFSDNNRFIFSSEIKAIIASGLLCIEPDYFSLHTPTRFQISPLTGFKNIHKLEPGHWLTFNHGILEKKKYWDIYPKDKAEVKEKDAIDQLDFLLRDATKLQMIADVPVGLFLSGGLDSSIIAALMRDCTTTEIHAFTIKFSDQDQKFEKMVDDSYYAKKIADQMDIRYHEFEVRPDIETILPKMIWHLEEPLADPAAINTWMISQSARDLGIIVLLNGMGGDEIFGGYRKHLACMLSEIYARIVPAFGQTAVQTLFKKIPVAASTQGFRSTRWIKRFLSFASLPKAEKFLSADLSVTPGQYSELFNDPEYYETYFYKIQKDRFQNNNLSYLTQMCLNDTKVMLPEHNLTYSDKGSMAASVESRPPLTDHRIVEFMFSLPPEYRIKRYTQKYLLKKVAQKYLPKEIICRPKAPFGSPLRSWIRGPLSTMVDDLISEKNLKNRGLYNAKYVKKLINNDRNGMEDNAHIIWTILTNELWFELFLTSWVK